VPLFDALLKAHPGKIRLVYKFVELNMHVHAEAAARAAYAAAQQGKFWEMEHLLFERQDHLEQGDLERYAHILKLDEAKWKVDLTSKATDDRIAQDKKLADDLKLVGTPTIYVNGREVDIEADEPLDQLLEERVANELGVPPLPPASAAPPAAPPPTASAATTATPPGSASAKPH
jgi:protein-disulfide isomerase